MRSLAILFLATCVLAVCMSRAAFAETTDVSCGGMLLLRNAITGDEQMNNGVEGATVTVSMQAGDIMQVLPYQGYGSMGSTGPDGRMVSRSYLYGDDIADSWYIAPYYRIPEAVGKSLAFSGEGGKFFCNGVLYGLVLGDKASVDWAKAASAEDLAYVSYVRVDEGAKADVGVLEKFAGRPMIVELTGISYADAAPVLAKLDLRGLILWEPGTGETLSVGAHKDLRMLCVVKGAKLNAAKFPEPLPALQTISLWCCTELTLVEGLSALSGLRYLNITFARNLTTDGLMGTVGLQGLCLRGCPAITSLATLTSGGKMESVDCRICAGLADISTLGDCKGLRRAFVSDNGVLSDVSAVGGLVALEELQIYRCPSVVVVPDLSHLANLTKLVVADCPLRNMDFAVGLASLENIDASGIECITDLKWLEGAANLTHVKVNYCDSLASLAGLAGHQLLLWIEARDTAIESLEELRDLPRLSYVWIDNCARLRSIAPLESLKLLRMLSARECMGLESLEPITRMPLLTGLSITCPADFDYAMLGALSHLSQVTLWGCSGLETMDFCATLGQLSFLSVVDCPKLANIEALASLKGLRYLYIRNAPMLTSLRPLFGLTSLAMLNLSRVPNVPREEIEELRQALKSCSVTVY